RILAVQAQKGERGKSVTISYQNKQRAVELPDGDSGLDNEERVMLVRNRLSRIYYKRKFFNYPISLSCDTLETSGFLNVMIIVSSYLYIKIFTKKEIENLEDYIISGFGKKLYLTFFKDYTERVWGIPCNELSADWGAQRIKGISIKSIIAHAFRIKKDN